MSEVFLAPLNVVEPLDMAQPWGDVVVPDRPVDAEAFFGVRLEIEIAPAIDTPPPHDRASAHLPAPNPVERFVVGKRIGVVEIVDEELARGFVPGACVPLNRLLPLAPFPL